MTDDADVLYNKFNDDYSSPPDNPPQHPDSDYNCVVATTGPWRVSRCDEQRRVVCQSDMLIGIIIYDNLFTTIRFFTYLLNLACFASSVFLVSSDVGLF